MKNKKMFAFIVILILVIVAPFVQTFAEENNEENEENIKEDVEGIINQEDIPDPPRDESLIGDEEDVQEVEIETPSSVTGEKSEGSGTVVDFSTTGARAFYTIVDNDNNTFYLMIDMDKADNNVYFLSDVDKEEVDNSSSPSEPENNNLLGGNESEEVNKDQSQAVDSSEVEVEGEGEKSEGKGETDNSSSNLVFTLVVVSVGVIGAFLYYFFIVKRKRDESIEDEKNIEDEMLEMYDDEDMYLEENTHNDESHNESDEA